MILWRIRRGWASVLGSRTCPNSGSASFTALPALQRRGEREGCGQVGQTGADTATVAKPSAGGGGAAGASAAVCALLAGVRIIQVVWPSTPEELVMVQRELAAASPALWRLRSRTPTIGACVVCFGRRQSGAGARGDPAWAAAAAMRGRSVVAWATVRGEAGAGYAPGLLALREGPTLEAAVRSLAVRPDVLLVDATGRDHPRRAGRPCRSGRYSTCRPSE